MQLEHLHNEDDPAVKKAMSALCQELVGTVGTICSNVRAFLFAR